MRTDHLSRHTEMSGVNVFAVMVDMDISAHSGYRDFVWAVELNRLGLEIVGLWPKTDAVANSVVSDLRVVISFITVIFLTIVPLICSLVRMWGDMIIIIDNFQLILPLTIVSLKLVIIRWKRPVISFIVKMIAEDWMTIKTDAERVVMIRRARVARFVAMCGYFLVVFGFIVLFILPSFGLHFRYLPNITDGERLLPLQAYYFYQTNKSPQFELTLVAQALTVIISGIVYNLVAAFFGLVVFHICGQLENFRRRLRNMSDNNFDCVLRNNVRTHLRLIRFANNIEDTFTLLMLGMVVNFGIAFCLFGFLVITIISGDEMRNISVSRKCFALFGVVTLLSHTFLYCAAGELIAEQCEKMYRTLCNFEWYEVESKKRKALILLLLRANEPFRITAGKIFPLTMSTFCALLKTSAGYVTFLLAMSDMKL